MIPQRREALRAFLKDKGILAEAVGEYYRAAPEGMPPFVGSWSRFKNAMMAMFMGADKLNRLVSAAAVEAKLEHLIAKEGGLKTVLASRELQKKVLRKTMGAAHKSVKRKVEGLVMTGRFLDAKEVLMREAVASTQFLYGPGQTAVITQKAGIAGRTGYIFQSWWT